MSYARILETGAYIWSDGEYMHFDNVEVPEETLNIFLARINDLRPEELEERIIKGRELIKLNKMEDIGDGL